MKIKFKVPRLFKVVLYTEAFLIVYLSGCVPVSINLYPKVNNIFSLLMITIALSVGIKILKLHNECKRILIYFLCLFVYFFICILNFSETYLSLAIRLIWFLVFIIFTRYTQYNNIDFYKMIYNVIIFLSGISLVAFFLINIMKIEIPYQIVYMDKSISYSLRYYNYFGLYYVNPTSIVNIFGRNIIKLNAIFWEPGVYAIFLNIALYYHIYCLSEKKKFPFILLIISIICTMSTTGLCVCVCLLTLNFLRKRNIQSVRKLFLAPCFATAIYIISIFLQYKKNSTNYTMGSYSLRIQDLFLGLKLWKSNILLGTGFNNTEVYTQLQGLGRGNSNGLVTWCFTMGVLGVILIVFPFVKNIIQTHERRVREQQIVYGIMLIILNMTEPMYTLPIMYFILANAYASNFRESKKSYE